MEHTLIFLLLTWLAFAQPTIQKNKIDVSQSLETLKWRVQEFSKSVNTEFKDTMDDFLQLENLELQGSTFISPEYETLPKSVNWTARGAVTPVRHHGHCGSCWAFVTAGALEGQHFRKTGKLIPLSPQNLIDCSQSYGNMGCKGGWLDRSIAYIKENGIATEQEYPYKRVQGSCYKAGIGATSSGFVKIPFADEKKLAEAVAFFGPAYVSIDGAHESFYGYTSGIYHEPKCSSRNNSHAALVVGYGTDPDGTDYWLVKNHWGTSWGIGGYIKMLRNANNHCGIASFARYPLV
ncbi:procathepsin L-like [Drosophila takahashii]|uniref:procathepsin L-like n=1 Tax=Drosophila takahashii TaxID=29030 RepID=UPI001CF84738|nr:procathepsin L-like [Drosophila takahashii]